jgi:uncharacterized protein YpbB
VKTYIERMARIQQEADLDAELVAHVLSCDERFCQEFRKLLNFTDSLMKDVDYLEERVE